MSLVVVVVVEWLYYSKRIIFVRWADLSDFFVDFRRKMCVFVSRRMKIVTFLRKKTITPLGNENTFPKQNHGNRRGF